MAFTIGVDIGGTFTDLVLADEAGVDVLKVPTNKTRPEDGVYEAIAEAAKRRGLSPDAVLRDTQVFVHGTTIATNTIVQRNGPKIGLIATHGHRDVLELKDGIKPDRYNLRLERPEPLIPRYLRRGIRGRLDYSGHEIEAIDSNEIKQILKLFQAEGVTSIAIALIWSPRNPEHERQLLEEIAKEWPEVTVCASSDVLPVVGEWKRTSATVLSAYVKPGLARYLYELEDRLRRDGLAPKLLVMQANGGAATVPSIERRPVFAVGSGPAAAPAAALRAGREFGLSDLIAVDMGGTSFDVAVIRDGLPASSTECRVADLPLGVDALDIISVGAGGGSIAWIDSGGALRVGPESAGSTPGPACYGRGGTQPTVTDADLVLGYLDASNPLGGALAPDQTRAIAAIRQHIAEPLGLSVFGAAVAVFDIVNHNMVEAIRLMSIARGIDPRGFALVVGGGAGPVHGGRLAQILEMDGAIIPREAGGLCAMGMVAADVRHDYVQLALTRGDALTDNVLSSLGEVFSELEHHATAALQSEGFSASDIRLQRYADARYRNQFHDLTVPVPPGPITADAFGAMAQAFHSAHEAAYTYALRDAAVDVIHARLTAFGRVRTPDPAPIGGTSDPSRAQKGTRRALFPELGDYTETPVFDADRLGSGASVPGPAILERQTTTIVVFPDQRLDVNEYGTFRLFAEREGERER